MPSSPCSPSSDRVLQAYVVAGLGPLGCLFHQHGVEEADERGPGREDLDHLGPLANLLVRLPSNCWPRSAAMAATATRGRLSRPGSEPGPGALSRQEACPSARASSAAGLAEGARPEPYYARRTGRTARRGVCRGGLRLLVDGSARPSRCSAGGSGCLVGGWPLLRLAPRAGPALAPVRLALAGFAAGAVLRRARTSPAAPTTRTPRVTGSPRTSSRLPGRRSRSGPGRSWCVPAWPPTAGSTWSILVSRS